MNINNKIRAMQQELRNWRQRLHAEPELAFQETATARFIARLLRRHGIESEHMAKTGVVGILHGRSGPGKGPAIMLRADMDALPMREETGVPYASSKPGVHHACGHDGHMAMLLGAAKYLVETRNFEGTVYLVFQPAEESIGGAKEMMKSGLFEKFPADAIYGLHNFPGLPLGKMASGTGPMLSESEDFKVVFRGKGGHAARADQAGDVVIAMAEAIVALRQMAQEQISPDEPAMLSVCAVHTDGSANNVMAEGVSFNGSLRTFDPALHARLKENMSQILSATAEKYGLAVETVFENGYPMLVNHAAETDFALGVARQVAGDENVISTVPKTLGTEDFAWFLQKKPGNFMVLGTGPQDGSPAPDLHSPKYDFNDAALPYGVSYWVRLVEEALPVQKPPACDAVPPPAP